MRTGFWKSLVVGAAILVAGVGLYLLLACGLLTRARARLVRRMGVALWDGPRGVAFGIDAQGRVRSVKVFRRERFTVEEREGRTVLSEHLGFPGESPPGDEALAQAPRPGPAEIVPGVGACGARLGDAPDAIELALGPPFTRRGRGSDETWHYDGLALSLRRGRVDAVVVTRAAPRTPEGIGVGSTEPEARGAYGALRKFGAAVMLEERQDPRELVARVVGTAWWGLVASVCACLLVGLRERGATPTVVLLACAGVTLFVWGWALLFPVSWGIGGGDFRGHLSERLAALFRVDPFAGAWPAAAVLGMFLTGRLASRLSGRRERVVFACAVLGAGLCATLLYASTLLARPTLPSGWADVREWGALGLLAFGALPGMVLAGCFLGLASQRRKWWRPVLRALALPEPAWFERLKKRPPPDEVLHSAQAERARQAIERFRRQRGKNAEPEGAEGDPPSCP